MAEHEPEVTSGTPEPTRRELGRPAGADGISGTISELAGDTELDRAGQRRLLTRLAAQTGGAWRSVWRPREAVRWLTDQTSEIAPHIPIRDLATLRRHYPDLGTDALAERLVRNASRVTAGIGAAGGGIAAVEWIATPTLLSAPVLIAAETLAVVAVEIKLIGELHEAYGQPIPGTGTQRAAAMVGAWAGRRGVNPLAGARGAAIVLGSAARKELSGQLAKRFGRNLTTMGPFLSGAAVASYLNRRATKALGEQLRKDLRRLG